MLQIIEEELYPKFELLKKNFTPKLYCTVSTAAAHMCTEVPNHQSDAPWGKLSWWNPTHCVYEQSMERD